MIIDNEQFKIGWSVRGKVGTSSANGRYLLGVSFLGNQDDSHGIYQNRSRQSGRSVVLMRNSRPTNPRSVAQQANRQKFADGMAAWSALTDEQRLAYNKSARRRQMFGWGWFLREYFRNN